MTAPVAALVLLAAALHASWNAILRSGGDRLWSVAVLSASSGLIAAATLPFLPLPAPASWPFAVASVVIHIFYRLMLVRAYRLGELGEVYPVSRGSAPLLVTLGAALIAGELPSSLALLGIGFVSFGIIGMADLQRLKGRGIIGGPIVTALAIGLLIAAYTIVDGLGARLSGHAIAYVLWVNALDGPAVLLIMMGMRRGMVVGRGRPGDGWRAVLGGVISMTGYGVVVWAMTLGAMGTVSALREVSVVFAVLIGRFVLGETLTWRRLVACLVIAAGAVLLALGR